MSGSQREPASFVVDSCEMDGTIYIKGEQSMKIKTVEQIQSHARDHAAYGWSSMPWPHYGVNTDEDRRVYMEAYYAQREMEKLNSLTIAQHKV